MEIGLLALALGRREWYRIHMGILRVAMAPAALLLLYCQAHAQSAQPQQHGTFIIYIQSVESNPTQKDGYDRLRKSQLTGQQNPPPIFKSMFMTKNADLGGAAFPKDFVIDTLMIDSDGGMYFYQDPNHNMPLPTKSRRMPELAKPDDIFNFAQPLMVNLGAKATVTPLAVNLRSPSQVSQSFGFLASHYARYKGYYKGHSMIHLILSGCHFVPKGLTPAQIAQLLIEYANNFHMEFGSLYVNQGEAREVWNTSDGTFDAQETQSKLKEDDNQGYSLVITPGPDETRRGTVYRDNFIAVQGRIGPPKTDPIAPPIDMPPLPSNPQMTQLIDAQHVDTVKQLLGTVSGSLPTQ